MSLTKRQAISAVKKVIKAEDPKNLSDRLTSILSTDSESRACNYRLYDVYMGAYHSSHCKFEKGNVFYRLEKGIPLQETVSRTRRKLQATGKFKKGK